MKRLIGNLKRRGSSPGRSASQRASYIPPQGDSPEAVTVREVTAFCESGAPDSQTAGDEYLHLPAIVDSAESSPAAAKEAANTIRRYLTKENYPRGFAQYNAIMLTRILVDNPGQPFTRNFDKQFVATVKELLREGKDLSVQQIMRETLDYIDAEKLQSNDTLGPLVEMWRKEKSKTARMYGNYANGPRNLRAPPFQQYQSGPQSRSRGLPPPDELAARIEEAKTTARLLLQTIQSTPSNELAGNELVKEFADRCKSAHKSIQQYMSSENPRPDEDTMLTLIETNDQLNIAMSKHQRAILQARKETGGSPPPQSMPGQNVYGSQPQASSYDPSTQLPSKQDDYAYSPPQAAQQQPSIPSNPYGQSQPAQNQYSYGQPQFTQSPPQPPSQNPYGQPQTARSPYGYGQQSTPNPYSSASPPAQYQGATSPAVSTRPLSGPPPGAKGAVRPPDYGYGSNMQPPQSQNRSSPPPVVPGTQSIDYGVADNPFADEAAAQPPAQPPRSFKLFDDARNNLQQHQASYQPPSQSSDIYSSGSRPSGPYQSTPSYMNEQDSALNHITMHGASALPGAAEEGEGQGAEAVQHHMSNLRV